MTIKPVVVPAPRKGAVSNSGSNNNNNSDVDKDSQNAGVDQNRENIGQPTVNRAPSSLRGAIDGRGMSPQRRGEVYDELTRHRCSPHKSVRTKRRDLHEHTLKRERGEREKLSGIIPNAANAGPHCSGMGASVSGVNNNNNNNNRSTSPTSNLNSKANDIVSGKVGKLNCPSPQSPQTNAEDNYSGYNSGDEHYHAKENAIPLDEWKRRDEQFEKCMVERGYVVKPVEEDGACLFRAISLQIYGDEGMHDVIRQHTMDYIYKNREYFCHFVTEDINNYIKRKRRVDSHGNHIEIQAMSEIYSRPVEVYCYKPTPINIFNSEQLANGYPPLRLSYQRGSHYNAIIDPYNATVGVGLGLAGYQPELQTKEAVRLSEQLEIEQTMFEDKIKTTDWEATNEAIEEQIARESYLQWCRDSLQRSRGATTSTIASASATITSSTANSNNDLASTKFFEESISSSSSSSAAAAAAAAATAASAAAAAIATNAATSTVINNNSSAANPANSNSSTNNNNNSNNNTYTHNSKATMLKGASDGLTSSLEDVSAAGGDNSENNGAAMAVKTSIVEPLSMSDQFSDNAAKEYEDKFLNDPLHGLISIKESGDGGGSGGGGGLGIVGMGGIVSVAPATVTGGACGGIDSDTDVSTTSSIENLENVSPSASVRSRKNKTRAGNMNAGKKRRKEHTSSQNAIELKDTTNVRFMKSDDLATTSAASASASASPTASKLAIATTMLTNSAGNDASNEKFDDAEQLPCTSKQLHSPEKYGQRDVAASDRGNEIGSVAVSVSASAAPSSSGTSSYASTSNASTSSLTASNSCSMMQQQQQQHHQHHPPHNQQLQQQQQQQQQQKQKQQSPKQQQPQLSSFYQELLQASFAGFGEMSEAEMLQQAIQMSTQEYIEDLKRKY